eukprot:6022338-Amphidinium_carterae.1
MIIPTETTSSIATGNTIMCTLWDLQCYRMLDLANDHRPGPFGHGPVKCCLPSVWKEGLPLGCCLVCRNW